MLASMNALHINKIASNKIARRETIRDEVDEADLAPDETAISWRELFHYEDDKIPGICLSGTRCRECLTQAELSKMTGISRKRISEMENGRRPIDPASAQILAKALNADPALFSPRGG